jgi:protein-S-isoprenylcysteine O-methyltransferase Ste14
LETENTISSRTPDPHEIDQKESHKIGRELKFIFAPLGVAIGISVFIFFSTAISKTLNIQSISALFPFIPKIAFVTFGIILLVLFLPIFIAGIYYLNRRGAVGQPSTLRIHGIYKYSRNPMYIGVSMTIIGIGFIILNAGVILGGLLWFLITFIQCKREEKELFVRFGNEYKSYKYNTPMFLPNFAALLSNVANKRGKNIS